MKPRISRFAPFALLVLVLSGLPAHADTLLRFIGVAAHLYFEPNVVGGDNLLYSFRAPDAVVSGRGGTQGDGCDWISGRANDLNTCHSNEPGSELFPLVEAVSLGPVHAAIGGHTGDHVSLLSVRVTPAYSIVLPVDLPTYTVSLPAAASTFGSAVPEVGDPFEFIMAASGQLTLTFTRKPAMEVNGTWLPPAYALEQGEFIAAAIPEPGMAPAVILALGSLAFYGWKRRV